MRVDDPEWLGEQARRCLRLAKATSDQPTVAALSLMAGEYEREAVAPETTIIVEPIADAEPQPPLQDWSGSSTGYASRSQP